MGNNSEFAVKKQNLKPWQKGVSGNPTGRKAGTRNIKTVIQELLYDPDLYNKLPLVTASTADTPLEAIIIAITGKALNGDIKATELLLRYGFDRDLASETEPGFFNDNELRIIVVNEADIPEYK